MLVQFEGTDYEFDIESLALDEARYIKKVTGFTIRGLLNGLEDLDPDALVACYWLMLKQNGQMTDLNKVNFPVLKFADAIGEASEREEAEGKEADPTEAEPAANPV